MGGGLRTFMVGLLIALLAGLAAVGPAAANGGTVRVSSQRAGPYDLTVFTHPTPIRVGAVDVSVLVQRAGSSDTVQDAVVAVSAEPVGHSARGGTFEATHERATNKLYYAADVQLPTAGRWEIQVHVSGPAGVGQATFQVEAEEAGPLDDRFLMALLVAPPLFVVAWLLSRRRRTAPGRDDASPRHP